MRRWEKVLTCTRSLVGALALAMMADAAHDPRLEGPATLEALVAGPDPLAPRFEGGA